VLEQTHLESAFLEHSKQTTEEQVTHWFTSFSIGMFLQIEQIKYFERSLGEISIPMSFSSG